MGGRALYLRKLRQGYSGIVDLDTNETHCEIESCTEQTQYGHTQKKKKKK